MRRARRAALALGFVIVDRPSTRIRLLPNSEPVAPTSVPPTGSYHGWREPPWGPIGLAIDFAAWTKFGGVDAAFRDNGVKVVIETHHTPQNRKNQMVGVDLAEDNRLCHAHRRAGA